MPVFRVPRSHAESEVAHLENAGYRVVAAVADGDDVLVFSNPLWRPRHAETPPGYLPATPELETRAS